MNTTTVPSLTKLAAFVQRKDFRAGREAKARMEDGGSKMAGSHIFKPQMNADERRYTKIGKPRTTPSMRNGEMAGEWGAIDYTLKEDGASSAPQSIPILSWLGGVLSGSFDRCMTNKSYNSPTH